MRGQPAMAGAAQQGIIPGFSTLSVAQAPGLRTVFSNGDSTGFLLREGRMAEQFIARGFKGRAGETARALTERIPPGQYATQDFPVLSAGPTPRTSPERWDLSISGEMAAEVQWTWDAFRKLPRDTVTVDVHCVTKWSKLDTVWTGVAVDTLLKGMHLDAPPALSSLFATAVTRRICHSPTSAAERRGWLTNTTDVRSRPSTGGRRACWCRTSIFGKARRPRSRRRPPPMA